LVGEERTSAVWGRGVDCVDGGNYGEKVLEFVEVVGCWGDGSVEGVEKGGIELAEGKLGDNVWEIKC
jgi:hypothetical protein